MNDDPKLLAERFTEALARVDGDPELCDDAAAAHQRLAELCGGKRVVVDDHPDLEGLGDELDRVDDPWEAEVGVTGVVAAIAETGTLALAAGIGTPRSTSLVPPVHVALVPIDRLVAGIEDAFAQLGALDPKPSNLQLITGPSRSGDIEMKLVRGVHGPREVHVLLYPR